MHDSEHEGQLVLAETPHPILALTIVLVWHHRSSSSFLMVSFCLSTLQISFPLEESVSTIGSYCMSSSFPPLSLDLAPLLVAESDDEGSKKALKKTQLNSLSSQVKMYLNYIIGFT